MFKRPLFWIIFVILFVAGIFFLLKAFPQVMSFINLDVSMTRKEAVNEAVKLAEELELGPENYETAVIFDQDYYTQIYTELEGGGKEEFNRMLQDDIYNPYQWQVRLFRENETRELTVSFTPDGRRYGFREKLPESLAGNNISKEEALIRAEEFLINVWIVDLDVFQLIEEKNNEVISGRIDHTFVYERTDASLQEAEYRLRITVSGDRITEVENFVKVPEAFSRRYSEMRSANNTIAMGGQIAMAVFYGFGGILLGIFLLMRKRWLIWKQGLFWAFVVAFLGFISSFNYLPISWFWYDTAISKSAFIFQNVLQFFISFLTDFILLALSFIAAESLTRKAFPKHIQFWKIWQKDAVNSDRILGNTLAGYILTVFSLCYVTLFYFITTKYLNWWNPSSMLTNPNVLATPFPWFSALATALHAGFWEEALFRAVPLAGMVLIGQKLNKRRLFLILGLVLQLLIFGAGHANYAAQPSFARVVELIVPSLIFAFLYLRFGLLTAVLLHFAFDAVLMSMPVWISSDSSLIPSKVLLIIVFLIPLWIVLYKRYKYGKKDECSSEMLNETWKPEPIVKKEEAEVSEASTSVEFKTSKLLLLIGIIGLVIWGVTSVFHDYSVQLDTNKKAAVAAAEMELGIQDIELGEEWEVQAAVINPVTDIDRYVWQEGGKDIYCGFLGNIIPSSRWRVRFVKFTGDVAERAEEYLFFVKNGSEVYGFSHSLPENREGAELEEAIAREMALSALQDQFPVDISGWKEITAAPEKLPNRTNWRFTYSDTLNYKLKESELRYTALISGDKVTLLMRNIHVPEDWTREQRNLSRTANSLQNFTGIIVFLLYFAAFVIAIISWTKKRFDLKFFWLLLIFLLVVQIIDLINKWPALVITFTSSQPFGNQAMAVILRGLLGIIVTSFGLAVIGGWIKTRISSTNKGKPCLTALAWAGITAGIFGLAGSLAPVWEPLKENIFHLGYRIPFAADLLLNIKPYIVMTLLLYFVYYLTDSVSRKWSRNKLGSFILVVILTAVFLTTQLLERMVPGNIVYIFAVSIVFSVIFLLIYKSLLRYFPAYLPMITGVVYALLIFNKAFYGNYPGEFAAKSAAFIILILVSLIWLKLNRKN